MIPKKIHYCWFGGNPLPDDALRYIESWRKFCPDYEIKEWNESNFDMDSYPYAREAYDSRKFAFVSDVARLYALYTEGGIYMDTDVEVLKPLDGFLKYDGVSGFESSTQIATGLMASRDLHPLVKEWLDEYEGIHFVREDGSLDLTTNVTRITNSCLRYGFVPDGTLQTVRDFTFFPSEYFCPKDYRTGALNVTENTYTIHHFAGSWLDDETRALIDAHKRIFAKYGNSRFSVVVGRLCYLCIRFRYGGIRKTVRYYARIIRGNRNER